MSGRIAETARHPYRSPTDAWLHLSCTPGDPGPLIHIRVHPGSLIAAADQDRRMVSATHVITHLGGVARGTLLQEYGITRNALARAVREGDIIRIRPGVFATHAADRGLVVAAAHGGALTCARALSLHGVWTLELSAVAHVWLGGHGRSHHRACRCVSHYFEGRAGLGLAPLEDALVHVFLCGGDEIFFAALESALTQRKINQAARGRIRRRLPIAAQWLVDLARSDAASGLESLLRLRLHLCGIRLDCQVVIPTVGRVDFVIEDRLILEADGKDNHDDESHRHRDRVRDAAASALGYETLRFDYAQIVHAWPSVEAAVVGAVVRLRERD
jgi:very-short-patch-repair endonuclease